VEMPGKRFFLATLFVPQINEGYQGLHPIVVEFVKECLK
jgi:hypothetical protein